MWVEFVVGSRPCSEGFSPGSLVFLPPQKPTFLNFNSMGNSSATGSSVEDRYVPPSLNNSDAGIIVFPNFEDCNAGQMGHNSQEDCFLEQQLLKVIP